MAPSFHAPNWAMKNCGQLGSSSAPTAHRDDYVKREVMIPMRDGVKLHTVIVVPKGRKERADPPHPNALQRLQAGRAQRQSPHMLAILPPGR